MTPTLSYFLLWFVALTLTGAIGLGVIIGLIRVFGGAV